MIVLRGRVLCEAIRVSNCMEILRKVVNVTLFGSAAEISNLCRSRLIPLRFSARYGEEMHLMCMEPWKLVLLGNLIYIDFCEM